MGLFGPLAVVFSAIGYGLTVNELAKRYRGRGKPDPTRVLLTDIHSTIKRIEQRQQAKHGDPAGDGTMTEGFSYDDLV